MVEICNLSQRTSHHQFLQILLSNREGCEKRRIPDYTNIWATMSIVMLASLDRWIYMSVCLQLWCKTHRMCNKVIKLSYWEASIYLFVKKWKIQRVQYATSTNAWLPSSIINIDPLQLDFLKTLDHPAGWSWILSDV